MSVIRITGLPSEKKYPVQIKILRSYLRRSGVQTFSINGISNTRGTDMKEVAVEVKDPEEVYVMESFLNKVPYRKEGMPHFLKAEVMNYDPDSSESQSPRGGGHRSNRYRSRSPGGNSESNVGMEIEFLRKKRELIAEERRILAERKKLEMMKEYGASAYRELEGIDIDEDHDMGDEDYDDMPPNQYGNRPSQRPAPQIDGIPYFLMPCKHIAKQMRPTVLRITKDIFERRMLMKMLRAELRRTLALMLDGKGYTPSTEITKRFRRQHPVEDDEQFVKKLLNTLRWSCWPVPAKRGKPPKEKKEYAGTPITTPIVKKEPQTKKKPVAVKKEVVDDGTSVSEIKDDSTGVEVKKETQGESAEVADADVIVQADGATDTAGGEKPADVIDQGKTADVTDENTDVAVQNESAVVASEVEPAKDDNSADKVESTLVQGTDPVGAVEVSQAADVDLTASETEPMQADAVLGNDDEDDWVANGVDWDGVEDSKDGQ